VESVAIRVRQGHHALAAPVAALLANYFVVALASALKLIQITVEHVVRCALPESAKTVNALLQPATDRLAAASTPAVPTASALKLLTAPDSAALI